MQNKNIYFYIPGAESLNVLYFLSGRYGSNLTVISPSLSVAEICKIIGLKHVYPDFYSLSERVPALGLKWKVKNNFLLFIKTLFLKLQDLYCMTRVIIKTRKQVASMPDNCTLYYSTFFFDVPGITFLGAAVKRKDISIKLVWPSHVRFNKIIRPSVLSETFILNLLTSNLFTQHLHPTAGRIIGIDPNYLRQRNISFVDDGYVTETILPAVYKKSAFSLLNIKTNDRPRVMFLGEYSVEHGVGTYGELYSQLLELLGKIDGIEVFYKPHPLYHSITHPSLSKLTVLDTQIPIEFLDDGSWSYIVAFFTAALMTKKLSKCICLLKLEELKMVSLNINESLKLMEKSNNDIIYPASLSSLEALLKS